MALVKSTALLVLAGVAWWQTAGAADGNSGRQLIEQFVREVRTMSGRFEQSLVDANNEVVETSNGTFAIQRPGQLRWVYRAPYEQVLVADGLNVWSYDVDLAQVTVKPQAELLSSTPALVLGGSENVLDDFEYEESFEDRGTVWVRLSPRRSESSFRSVELGFTGGDLSRMIFNDNLDQATLVALFDVELNEEIDPAQFRFSPPENADLVGTPLSPEAAASRGRIEYPPGTLVPSGAGSARGGRH